MFLSSIKFCFQEVLIGDVSLKKKKKKRKWQQWDFSGGPVVKIPTSTAAGVGEVLESAGGRRGC